MGEGVAASTPEAYLEALDEPRRSDVVAVHEMVRATAPALAPRMQAGMLAYGRYTYRYASGRCGEWFPIGLASNKQYISLYVTAVVDGHYVTEAYRDRLPKADIGKSCVRFKRLADLDRDALTELIREGAKLDGRHVTGG